MGNKVHNISGFRFGSLVAQNYEGHIQNGRETWSVVCDCGTKKNLTYKVLASGNTKSCGCQKYSGKARADIENGNTLYKECPVCMETFSVKKSHFDRTRCCSKKCISIYFSTAFIGDKNPKWRGGISTDIDHIRSRAKKWRDAHPEKVSVYNQQRRVRINKASGSHTSDDILRIFSLQKGRCAYCHKKVGKKYHVDHIHPLSKGGDNNATNLCIACASCNTSKGSQLPHEWAKKRGMLL